MQIEDRFGEGRLGQDGLSDSTGASVDMSASDFGDEQVTWIEWFCHLKGHEFFVEVDDDFVQDDFNLTYLNKVIMEYYDCDIYREALNMILDYDDHDDVIHNNESDSGPLIEQASQCLYGLVHARFILTTRGMAAMFEKYNSYVYGSCPLLDCHAQNQAVLPMGLSDAVGRNGTKIYCPRCKELYIPKSSKLENIDGAYFGTSFPHLFFLTYPHLRPASEPRTYIPRIFGFKMSSRLNQKQIAPTAANESLGPGNSQPSQSQPGPHATSTLKEEKESIQSNNEKEDGQEVGEAEEANDIFFG